MKKTEIIRTINLFHSLSSQIRNYIIHITSMQSRVSWTEHQDNILRYLKEQRREKKWSTIAKQLEEEFSIQGRTGKQCRERYHNHLDSAISSQQWTKDQDDLLLTLHEEYGNKWSSISQKLQGRTDNCIKNHFYSKLRKSIRTLNRLISNQLDPEYQLISSHLLSKIIETSELKFKSSSKIDEDSIEFSVTLKNKLFIFDTTWAQATNKKQIMIKAKELIDDIFFFEKNIRKPSKLLKRAKSYEPHKFLHPSDCLKLNHSISSDVSSNGDDSSGCFSSSYCSEQEEIQQQDLRKRSRTNHTSKDKISRNSSEAQEDKQKHQIFWEDKTQKEEKYVPLFHVMDIQKYNETSVLEHSVPTYQLKVQSGETPKSADFSDKSNQEKGFKTFEHFWQLDLKQNMQWFEDGHDAGESNQILWRVISPKTPLQRKIQFIQDDYIPIQRNQMEQEH